MTWPDTLTDRISWSFSERFHPVLSRQRPQQFEICDGITAGRRQAAPRSSQRPEARSHARPAATLEPLAPAVAPGSACTTFVVLFAGSILMDVCTDDSGTPVTYVNLHRSV